MISFQDTSAHFVNVYIRSGVLFGFVVLFMFYTFVALVWLLILEHFVSNQMLLERFVDYAFKALIMLIVWAFYLALNKFLNRFTPTPKKFAMFYNICKQAFSSIVESIRTLPHRMDRETAEQEQLYKKQLRQLQSTMDQVSTLFILLVVKMFYLYRGGTLNMTIEAFGQDYLYCNVPNDKTRRRIGALIDKNVRGRDADGVSSVYTDHGTVARFRTDTKHIRKFNRLLRDILTEKYHIIDKTDELNAIIDYIARVIKQDLQISVNGQNNKGESPIYYISKKDSYFIDCANLEKLREIIVTDVSDHMVVSPRIMDDIINIMLYVYFLIPFPILMYTGIGVWVLFAYPLSMILVFGFDLADAYIGNPMEESYINPNNYTQWILKFAKFVYKKNAEIDELF